MDVDRTRSSRTRSAKTNSIEEGHRASIAQLGRQGNRAQTWGAHSFVAVGDGLSFRVPRYDTRPRYAIPDY